MAEQMICNHQVVGSTPIASSKCRKTILRKGGINHLKEITKEEIEFLFREKILESTERGVVDKNGSLVSYTKTKHKRFIMDEYADMARNLVRGSHGKEKT